MTIREIEAAALNLELAERARLAQKLLRSLDELSEDEIEQLWAEEALRRDEELDAGEATARDGEEVLRELRAVHPTIESEKSALKDLLSVLV